MQALRPHPRPTEADPRWFSRTVKSENHASSSCISPHWMQLGQESAGPGTCSHPHLDHNHLPSRPCSGWFELQKPLPKWFSLILPAGPVWPSPGSSSQGQPHCQCEISGTEKWLTQLSAGHVDTGWPADWNTHELACEVRAGEEKKQDRRGGKEVLVPMPPHPNTELQAVQEFCIWNRPFQVNLKVYLSRQENKHILFKSLLPKFTT